MREGAACGNTCMWDKQGPTRFDTASGDLRIRCGQHEFPLLAAADAQDAHAQSFVHTVRICDAPGPNTVCRLLSSSCIRTRAPLHLISYHVQHELEFDGLAHLLAKRTKLRIKEQRSWQGLATYFETRACVLNKKRRCKSLQLWVVPGTGRARRSKSFRESSTFRPSGDARH